MGEGGQWKSEQGQGGKIIRVKHSSLMREEDVCIPEILEPGFQGMNIPIQKPDGVERIAEVGGKMIGQVNGQRPGHGHGQD
jgi:hypothetical protein